MQHPYRQTSRGGHAASLQVPSASAQQRSLVPPSIPPTRNLSPLFPDMHSDSQNPSPNLPSGSNSPVGRWVLHDNPGDDGLEMNNSSDDESLLYVDPDDVDGCRTVEDVWDELWESNVVEASVLISSFSMFSS